MVEHELPWPLNSLVRPIFLTFRTLRPLRNGRNAGSVIGKALQSPPYPLCFWCWYGVSCIGITCFTFITPWARMISRMAGYTKLFGSLIHSTVWREPNHVRIVWITLLAISDRDGIAEASIPGLADAARVTLTECEQALEVLESPDPYSRNKAHQGRRIAEAAGGWLILNHEDYRLKLGDENKAAAARARWERYRDAKKAREKAASRPLKGEAKYVKASKGGATPEQLDKIVNENLPRSGQRPAGP